MKVLILSNLCPPYCIGGYEIGCFNVARELDARGHDVKLLTTPSPLAVEDPPFVERCLDLRAFLPLDVDESALDPTFSHESAVSHYRNTYTLIYRMRSFQPDVVYLFNLLGIGGLALLDVLNIAGVPWVLHLMDRVPVYLKRGSSLPVLSIFNAAASGIYGTGTVISMSRALIDMISEDGDIDFPQGVAFVPGWVDTTGIEARSSYLSDGAKVQFVNAGIVQAHKGIDLIIEASAQLRSEGFETFAVDIYGSGQIAHYREVARRQGVDHCVRFLGNVPQQSLIKKYESYDCFLFPTWENEPFGFAPIEAAAAGCVPIVTAQCGAAERLVNGVHCLKIPRRTEDLAAAMRKVIRREVDLARMGAAAGHLTRSDLSFRRCMDRIEDILKAASGKQNVERIMDDKILLLSYVKHLLALELRFRDPQPAYHDGDRPRTSATEASS